jgi:hypothetical protein
VEDLDSVKEGESGEDLDGSGGRPGEGAGARHGPGSGRWGVSVDPIAVVVTCSQGRRGGEADVRREPDGGQGGGRWGDSVDSVAVRETIGEDLTAVEAIEEWVGARVATKLYRQG